MHQEQLGRTTRDPVLIRHRLGRWLLATIPHYRYLLHMAAADPPRAIECHRNAFRRSRISVAALLYRSVLCQSEPDLPPTQRHAFDALAAIARAESSAIPSCCADGRRVVDVRRAGLLSDVSVIALQALKVAVRPSECAT